MKLFKWLITNSDVVKDYAWILFSIVGMVISILTYNKAKESVLQPLRSEVIKRQTDSLVNLFSFLGEDEYSLFWKIDYASSIKLNTLELLCEYDLINDNDINRIKEILDKNKIDLAEPNSTDLYDILGDLNTISIEVKEPIKVIDIKFSNCNSKLNYVYNELNKYKECVFIPGKIQKMLNKINNEIDDNILILQQKVIIKEINKYIDESINNKSPVDINLLYICNLFNQQINKHSESIIEIKKEVRTYLMVDKEWGNKSKNNKTISKLKTKKYIKGNLKEAEKAADEKQEFKIGDVVEIRTQEDGFSEAND